MFAISHLALVPNELARVYAGRIESPPGETSSDSIRGQVGLFLVRDDGANGTKLANEVVSSFGYWDGRTGQHFDCIFLG